MYVSNIFHENLCFGKLCCDIYKIIRVITSIWHFNETICKYDALMRVFPNSLLVSNQCLEISAGSLGVSQNRFVAGTNAGGVIQVSLLVAALQVPPALKKGEIFRAERHLRTL